MSGHGKKSSTKRPKNNLMEKFQLFADPWWVNLFIFVPFVAYYAFRRKKLDLHWGPLLICFLFGIAFGFVESSVVIYLRGALDMLSSNIPSIQVVADLSVRLLSIEVFREAATMIMLIAVSFLAAKTARERWAIFLWTFATWDIFYYIFLWLAIRWPSSLTTSDVLFLIPMPWHAQVWFPIAVDVLMLLAIAGAKWAHCGHKAVMTMAKNDG